MLSDANYVQNTRAAARIRELVTDKVGTLPVWIRAPKFGQEYFSGLSRSKLYELHWQGKIQSKSIRQPGQVKGTRLFNLRSVLDFIETCDDGRTASK